MTDRQKEGQTETRTDRLKEGQTDKQINRELRDIKVRESLHPYLQS